MVELSWHRDAKIDLIQIYYYIYKNSVYYSIKTINDIVDLVNNLERLPYMGRKVPEYDIYNIRELIYKSYRIIYEVQPNKIIIHRIWHSARNLSNQLIS